MRTCRRWTPALPPEPVVGEVLVDGEVHTLEPGHLDDVEASVVMGRVVAEVRNDLYIITTQR